MAHGRGGRTQEHSGRDVRIPAVASNRPVSGNEKGSQTALSARVTSPRPSPSRDRTDVACLSNDSAPVSFNAIYSGLAEGSNWSLSLSFLVSGASRALPSMPNRKDLWNACHYNIGGAVKSWALAHVWYGAMSTGRGEHYQDIQLAYAERERCWQIICALPESTALETEDDCEQLRTGCEAIHDDMLKTIALLKQELGVMSEHHNGAIDAPESAQRYSKNCFSGDVVAKVYRQHLRLFGKHRNSAAANDKASQVAETIRELLKHRAALSEISGRVSALVAQLVLDQATIVNIAGIITRGSHEHRSGELTRRAIRGALETRQASCIHKLRRTFLSLDDADHVMRAIDYFMTGLANPQHKLNKALFDAVSRAKGCNHIDKEDVSKSCADMLLAMKTGKDVCGGVKETIKLEGGWSRGFRGEWLLVGAAPALKGGYVDLAPQIGADQSYTYRLKIEREETGVKISFARAAVIGASMGMSASVYCPKLPGFPSGKSASYIYSGIGSKLRAARAEEDMLSITIKDDDPGALKCFLSDLLAGQMKDPYALLEKASRLGTVHNVKDSTSLSLSVGIGPVTQLSKEVTDDISVKAKISPVTLSADLTMAEKVSGRGYAYDSADNALDETKQDETINPMRDRPRAEFQLGLLSIFPRIQAPFGLSGGSVFSDGRQTGPRVTGELGAAIKYKTGAKSWKETLGSPAKPTCGAVSIRRDAEHEIGTIACDLTLPRTGKILDHPTIKALLQNSGKDARLARSYLIDALSFTTEENRGEIKTVLQQLKASRSDLAHRVEDLESFSDFTLPEDRNRFRKGLKKMTNTGGGRRLIGLFIRPILREDDRQLRQVVKLLLALTDRTKPDRWPPRGNSDTITVNVKAGPQDIREFRAGTSPPEQIETAIERGGVGQITSISVSGSRAYTTAFEWPILFAFGSHARVTLSRSRVWKLKENASGHSRQSGSVSLAIADAQYPLGSNQNGGAPLFGNTASPPVLPDKSSVDLTAPRGPERRQRVTSSVQTQSATGATRYPPPSAPSARLEQQQHSLPELPGRRLEWITLLLKALSKKLLMLLKSIALFPRRRMAADGVSVRDIA